MEFIPTNFREIVFQILPQQFFQNVGKKLIVSLNHSFLIIRLYLYGVVINPQRRQWPWWYVNDKAKIINVLITANRSFIAT